MKFTPVPGWNQFCRQLHCTARAAFLTWAETGKIRFGEIFEEMKATRRNFIDALNYCKSNRNKIIDMQIASSFRDKNMNDFWKSVRKKKSEQNSGGNCVIDGFRDSKDVANLFANKFSAVTSAHVRNNQTPIFRPNLYFNHRIKSSDLTEAVKSLKTGIGFDGIHSNHFKFASKLTMVYITQFFNSCFLHNYFPNAILSGVISPLIKNKTGSVSSSENYREVMISSNFFKLIEYILLPVLKNYASLSPYQFGYRQNSSTIVATALLKETINKYVSGGSSVHTCFIDLSKAFERVNHTILINKLVLLGLPAYFTEILKSIFSGSSVSVHWQGVLSRQWNVCRGVRQGGVLSAYLFVLYFDDILKEISSMSCGCRLGLARVNAQAYADDVVILSPTLTGLQLIVDRFVTLADKLELSINVNKTCYMIFNDRFKNVFMPSILVHGEPLKRVSNFKYLGCILTDDLCGGADTERAMSAFNKSFGILFRKFYALDVEPFYNLFQSFCTSFYGADLWVNRKKSFNVFKKLSVSYHIALKKIVGCPKYFSNHLVCNFLSTRTFEHFINVKCFKFFRRMCINNNSIVF